MVFGFPMPNASHVSTSLVIVVIAWVNWLKLTAYIMTDSKAAALNVVYWFVSMTLAA